MDDDERFRAQLSNVLTAVGWKVISTADPVAGVEAFEVERVGVAIVETSLAQCSFLDVVRAIRTRSPATIVIVATAYPSISSAVSCTRIGVTAYLPKQLPSVFPLARRPSEDRYLSLERMEWEYINAVLASCDWKIGRAARTLGISRSTLRRKLLKHPSASPIDN